MRRDFFPDREAEMVEWARVFAAGLLASAGHYGVAAACVEAFDQAQRNFAEAYALATTPATRTKLATARKNTLRREMERQARLLARQLSNSSRMDDATRQKLGLAIPRARRRHVRPPAEAPHLRVRSVRGSVVTIDLRDGARHDTRARPDSAIAAMVYTHVGEAPPHTADEWRFAVNATRPSVALRFDPTLPPGTSVWFSAYWQTRRDERSPVSSPIQAYLGLGDLVGGGGVPADALRQMRWGRG